MVQICFSHRGHAAVGTVGAIKAVLAAVAARLYHQVAGLGSGFLQRELRVATVVSKSRLPGKQIAQCDVIIQPQTASRNLSAVQLDFAAPNLQLEQSGMVILRIKYQCTAVPHGHAHCAVAAAAVNDRQFTDANLARGRKATHIQAVSAQAVSVQIQREGLADIYAGRQHRVCQQLDGLTVSCRIQRGRHIGIIGFADASRKLRPAGRALAVFTDGARALGVRVGAGQTAGALVVLAHRVRCVRHHDNVLGQLFYTSVDERARLVFCALVIFRKSKPIAQQPQHIVVSICRSLYRNAVCTVACDNRAFLQATHQLAPVLDEQAAGKACLAFEFQRTAVLALLIVIYEDSRLRRFFRLGNRCFIADDQLAALYIQRRSALIGQAMPIHHERNGFFDRIPLCITAEADRVIICKRCQHRHRAAIRNALKGFRQINVIFAGIILCHHLRTADGANTIFNRFMRTGQAAGAGSIRHVVRRMHRHDQSFSAAILLHIAVDDCTVHGERRALRQIVLKLLALDGHLHAAVQLCADTQDQLAALHIDGGELSIGVHAAALNGHVLPHGQLAALHLYGGVSSA